MAFLADQRCFFHTQREAALKCPGCGRFYCRECASEHEGRWLCAACIGTPDHAPASKRAWGSAVANAFALLVSLLFLWGAFQTFGNLLLAIPAPTHDALIRPEGIYE